MATKKEVSKSVSELVRKIALGLSVLVFVVACSYLINAYIIEPKKNKDSIKDTSITNENDTQTVTVSGSNETIQKKYSALLNVNPDFVGKLYIEAIDEMGYNVVQCDNNERYLTTGFKGEATRYGTMFVDCRNNIKELDANTIIYGHNMRDGAQLGSLILYEKLENYKQFPTIKFNTIYRNCEWKIFSAFIINSDSRDDNGYVFPYRTITFPSDEKFDEFINDVKSRSFFINDSIDIKAGDKILTLSTCDTIFRNARFVLMARLVRDGESAQVDVSNARENKNQRFPQSWYDKKGIKNPFINADRFTLD